MAFVAFQKHGKALKAKMPRQFRGKPNIEAFLDSIGSELDELDVMFTDLIVQSYIDDAEGEMLLFLARLVNIQVGNSDENELRARIRAEARLNRSNGTIEDIYEVLALVLGQDAAMKVEDFYPASLVVTIGVPTTIPDILADLVRRTRAGGVGAQVIYSTVEDEDAFFFATGDTEEASATQGTADDAGTTGGAFADVEDAGDEDV